MNQGWARAGGGSRQSQESSPVLHNTGESEESGCVKESECISKRQQSTPADSLSSKAGDEIGGMIAGSRRVDSGVVQSLVTVAVAVNSHMENVTRPAAPHPSQFRCYSIDSLYTIFQEHLFLLFLQSAVGHDAA